MEDLDRLCTPEELDATARHITTPGPTWQRFIDEAAMSAYHRGEVSLAVAHDWMANGRSF